MAVSGYLYGYYLVRLANKEVDWAADTINCMLCTSSYTPAQTHQDKADITNEVAGTGYTAGGATLGSKTESYTAGTGVYAIDAANVTWTTSTITARTAVLYDDTPAAEADQAIICYQQSDADVSTTAGTFTVAWHADGIVKISVTIP